MNIIRTFLLIVAVATMGCTGSGMSKSQLQTAQVSLEKAMESENAGRYAEALPSVDSAISAGGLNPDQLSEAYLIRSRCYSMTGKLDLAEKDLATAEQGAPSPASFFFTKAILFAKQNKATESKSEFNKAIKIDPKLKMPN